MHVRGNHSKPAHFANQGWGKNKGFGDLNLFALTNIVASKHLYKTCKRSRIPPNHARYADSV